MGSSLSYRDANDAFVRPTQPGIATDRWLHREATQITNNLRLAYRWRVVTRLAMRCMILRVCVLM